MPDVPLDRQRKDQLARVLVKHLETDHDHVEQAGRNGRAHALVLQFDGRRLGCSEEAEFSLVAFLEQRRCEDVDRMVHARHGQGVKVVDVDIVGPQPPQQFVEPGHHLLGREHPSFFRYGAM